MYISKWIKGALILASLVFLCAWAFHIDDAWARAGGGRSSMGSRGSRSSSPPRSYSAPSSRPSQPSSGYRPTTPPPSQPSSFWRSFGGGMLGGLAGGLLFGNLFGGRGASAGMGGGGGGIGLFDILLLAGIAYLIYWYIKKKRQEAAAGPYQSTSQTVQMPYTYPPAYDLPQPQDEGDRDLEQGLAYIRQMDSSFDEPRFQDQCMDAFFKVQGAYANRDMSTVKNLLTPEMYQLLQADADKLKADRQINRLENIAVRSVDISEAWQESGQDFITVRVYANLLDYTVDETSGQVLSGSKTDPVKFEEYWTFTRPVGNNPWQLSAIQQAD
jgi:predicted lipid-binding transport protein (Tim44 family)